MTSAPELNNILPLCFAPDEQFQGPTGDWFTVYRSIVLDSWLLWKHAIPDWKVRCTVPRDVACNVTALARYVHATHMALPEYRHLSDSPFRVSRWWDPSEPDSEWASGRRALLRLEGCSASRFSSKVPRRFNLTVEPRSENWLEVALPSEGVYDTHSLDYDVVVTTERV